MKDFRILPFVIVVVMLAFSVRLAEFLWGLSDLTGAAHAVVSEQEAAEILSDIETAAGGGKEKDSDPESGSGGSTSHEDHEAQAGEPLDPNDTLQIALGGEEKHQEAALEPEDSDSQVEWRDATEEDLSYSNVKMEIFKDMSERRKGLEQKEKELITREALLQAAEKELDRKYQELSQLRTELERLLDVQSKEEDKQIQSLVRIYEGMKPKEAARIFDTLDLDVLVSVISRMSERKSSPILAKMNPERARTVTIMLAEQKTLPSLPDVN